MVMTSHSMTDRLNEMVSEAELLEAMAARLAVGLAAAHFKVKADQVLVGTRDRCTAEARDVAWARSSAAWLLTNGLNWSQQRAARALGMQQPAVAKAIRRVTDAEDDMPGLGAFMAHCEALLAMELGR